MGWPIVCGCKQCFLAGSWPHHRLCFVFLLEPVRRHSFGQSTCDGRVRRLLAEVSRLPFSHEGLAHMEPSKDHTPDDVIEALATDENDVFVPALLTYFLTTDFERELTPAQSDAELKSRARSARVFKLLLQALEDAYKAVSEPSVLVLA